MIQFSFGSATGYKAGQAALPRVEQWAEPALSPGGGEIALLLPNA